MKKNICTLIVGLIVFCGGCNSKTITKNIAHSSDGVPIFYKTYGSGDTALVFLHGWSCDSSYWREQVNYFKDDYQVVTVDLAGHGMSGRERKEYTFDAYAQDVKAVMTYLDCKKIILIGHSMSGLIIIKAGILDSRVAAAIGVDTLEDVTQKVTPEELQQYLSMFDGDFSKGVENFVSIMFYKDDDPALKAKVISQMARANPEIALNTLRHYLQAYIDGDVLESAKKANMPVHCINADLWPTNITANTATFPQYKGAEIITNAGHFIMLTESKEFNQELQNIVKGYK